MSWIEGPLVGFDTETTGVDPQNSRLVTASVIVRTTQGDVTHNWVADPQVEIPKAASDVHGITTEYAREHGEPIEQVLEAVATMLCDHMRQGHPVVAFNAGYDLGLMEAELRRHGLMTLNDRLGRISPVVDPLVLDRALDRWRKGSRRLRDLMDVYEVSTDDTLHDAEVDTRTTLNVLQAIVAKFPMLGEQSLDDLQQFQTDSYQKWAIDMEKFLHSKGKDAHIDPNWLPNPL